jgi:hypothetical protein
VVVFADGDEHSPIYPFAFDHSANCWGDDYGLSCVDFVDSILEALGLVVPMEAQGRPEDQANPAVTDERLRKLAEDNGSTRNEHRTSPGRLSIRLRVTQSWLPLLVGPEHSSSIARSLPQPECSNMATSAKAFFAGIGATFVILAVGFGGGIMLAKSALEEPSRFQTRAAD